MTRPGAGFLGPPFQGLGVAASGLATTHTHPPARTHRKLEAQVQHDTNSGLDVCRTTKGLSAVITSENDFQDTTLVTFKTSNYCIRD